jgi:hypothetical protein
MTVRSPIASIVCQRKDKGRQQRRRATLVDGDGRDSRRQPRASRGKEGRGFQRRSELQRLEGPRLSTSRSMWHSHHRSAAQPLKLRAVSGGLVLLDCSAHARAGRPPRRVSKTFGLQTQVPVSRRGGTRLPAAACLRVNVKSWASTQAERVCQRCFSDEVFAMVNRTCPCDFTCVKVLKPRVRVFGSARYICQPAVWCSYSEEAANAASGTDRAQPACAAPRCS